MTVVSVEPSRFTQNPLDILEEIVVANDWAFDRASQDEMVAEVQIHPRDVGHLRVGQEAQVKVTTYDTAKHGMIMGTLRRVSASTFQDQDGQPFFKAIIALDSNFVGHDPAQNPILPGMVVDANIRTGSKSLLRYLLKPVYRSLDVAFRER